MAEEAPEGFAKKGTTLEGRVGQLLRLTGFNVTRNEIIEGHEIDVYGEKNGKKIIVECKEYYTQLIDRDLILIFSTKVRDIEPDEAWFVTIYDFEPSALELCKRYGIRAINGYDLEELEDKAVIQREYVEPGSIPEEDRYLRLLNRRRTILSRENRRYEEIRKVVEQINSLRMKRIELPPFLFPTTASDLEEKYIWLSDLEEMPKITEEGQVEDIIINYIGTPLVRGFKVSMEKKYSLAPIVVIISLILSAVLLYYQHPRIFSSYVRYGESNAILILQYFIPSIILSIIVIYYREKLSYRKLDIINMPISIAEIRNNTLYLSSFTGTSNFKTFSDDLGDISSTCARELGVNLIDGKYLGESKDYIIEKNSWFLRGIQVRLNSDISKETGMDDTIIPIQFLNISLKSGNLEIYVNALYVLSKTFFEERKLT